MTDLLAAAAMQFVAAAMAGSVIGGLAVLAAILIVMGHTGGGKK